MSFQLFQVDAFSDKALEGNPAAVVPLKKWLSDEIMQRLAQENNLSETAFYVPTKKGYHIRWFSPVREVNLCGHATLAAAHVLFCHLDHPGDTIVFECRMGDLEVRRDGEWLLMNFPLKTPAPCPIPDALFKAFGSREFECHRSLDYMVVFPHEDDVRRAEPNLELLYDIDRRGVIVTAPSNDYDFVLRFFAPKFGIPEDPVTGSAFTQLAPFWADKLGKKKFHARQVSARGGDVMCEVQGDRVNIQGKAFTYLQGSFQIDD